MKSDSKRKASPIADAIAGFLSSSGMRPRVEQAQVVLRWAELVGPRIAAVSKALSVTADNVLLVAVNSHPWMTELSMMERDLLEVVNRVTPATPVRQIRFQLMR
jgi:predicted nucleic acid-binding Zn ribbon protein